MCKMHKGEVVRSVAIWKNSVDSAIQLAYLYRIRRLSGPNGIRAVACRRLTPYLIIPSILPKAKGETRAIVDSSYGSIVEPKAIADNSFGFLVEPKAIQEISLGFKLGLACFYGTARLAC